MFGKSANALIFRPEQLDAPLPGGNAPLLDVLCASLTAVSCDNGPDDSSDLLTRARNEIQSRMAEGSVSLKSVADGLKAPVWTLQRRLRDQGITFSELVEDVRRKLARHYVHQSGIPLTEVALLLGYSEASAFSRAFRQWYGVSPRTLRTHHRASRPGQ
jgi:AraC-like DNA-binding protein